VSAGKYIGLSQRTISILEELEARLSFEDIILFRSLAERDLSDEVPSQKSWVGGWASWAMGGWYGGVSEEEKGRLFEALRYDPDALFRAGNEVDPERVLSNINVKFLKGSMTCALSSPLNLRSYDLTSVPFLEFEQAGLELSLVVMGDGTRAKVCIVWQCPRSA
jgi:hypothetical protein